MIKIEKSNFCASNEILQYAISQGIIDLSDVTKQIDMNKKQKYLKQHPYSIWQGKNGKWYTKLFNEITEKKVLKKRNTQEEIEDMVVKYYENQEKNPTIKNIFYMWTEEKLKFGEITKSTVDRYEADFNRFFTLNDFQNKRICKVTEDELEFFIRKNIADKELTSKGYSNLRTLINGIFKYSKKHGYTSFSITNFMGDLDLSSRIFTKKVKSKEREVFFEDEIKLITRNIINNPTIKRLGVLLAFQTGLRVGELCTLKRDDIKQNVIHVQRTEIVYKDENGKIVHDVKEFPKSDAGDRYLMIPNSAMETINKIIKLNPFGEYLFCKNNKNRGFSRIYGKSFNYEIHKICEEIGINPRSTHKIRKTYGTTLLDANVDESIIIEQMGHSDIECTKKYYYYSNKNIDKKFQQITNAISI